MNFDIHVIVPAEAPTIWPVLFDIHRIAGLIPGCEQVEERVPLASYSAVMKQKLGPFKIDVPAEIFVEEHIELQRVRVRAVGRDRITGTTLSVFLGLVLDPAEGGGTRLGVTSEMVFAGRLASLGYPVVKKKATELFVEFERRLRTELGIL